LAIPTGDTPGISANPTAKSTRRTSDTEQTVLTTLSSATRGKHATSREPHLGTDTSTTPSASSSSSTLDDIASPAVTRALTRAKSQTAELNTSDPITLYGTKKRKTDATPSDEARRDNAAMRIARIEAYRKRTMEETTTKQQETAAKQQATAAKQQATTDKQQETSGKRKLIDSANDDEWCDLQDDDKQTNDRLSPSGRGRRRKELRINEWGQSGSAKKTPACTICRLEGHWANKCREKLNKNGESVKRIKLLKEAAKKQAADADVDETTSVSLRIATAQTDPVSGSRNPKRAPRSSQRNRAKTKANAKSKDNLPDEPKREYICTTIHTNTHAYIFKYVYTLATYNTYKYTCVDVILRI
jgi:hypothetical protein